jgi:hypothetical protein
MIISKVSHEEFNNGQRNLSTKDFLKHDLVHYAIDKVLFLYNDANPTTHTLEIERLAGLLHTVYDDTVTNEAIMEGAANMWGAYGDKVPGYLSYEFINRVRDMAEDLLQRYRQLKTGEAMELI